MSTPQVEKVRRARPSAEALRRESRRYIILAVAMSLIGLSLLILYGVSVSRHLQNPSGAENSVVAENEDAITVVVARTAGGPRAWKSYAQAIAYVAHTTGLPVKVRYAMSSEEMRDLFQSGEADAAFSCNSCYLDLQSGGTVVPLVSPMISGRGTDTAVVVVAAFGDVRTFDQLRNGTVAVVAPPSLAGNAYLRVLMTERSLDPSAFFDRVVVGASQERNLEDLYQGTYDAAVVNRSQLAGLPSSRYRIVVESEPFSLAPFIVSTAISEENRAAIRDALLGFRPPIAPDTGLVLEGFVPYAGTGLTFLARLKTVSNEAPYSSEEGPTW